MYSKAARQLPQMSSEDLLRSYCSTAFYFAPTSACDEHVSARSNRRVFMELQAGKEHRLCTRIRQYSSGNCHGYVGAFRCTDSCLGSIDTNRLKVETGKMADIFEHNCGP